ncbi:hypothetical protein FACS1894208_08570 [Clostridia bacterium]|nr:hypothetical protein FACS1894208_08570 [Clostridia bacterium]
MKKWTERPAEVANLMNPAFCGRLIYGTIKTYNDEVKRGFPFPLVYLVLPLLLHKASRQTINSRTQLLLWKQKNERLLIRFAERARQLVQITNEAIEFLMQTEYVSVNESGELVPSPTKRSLNKTKFTDDEVKECISKSEHVAKWFARAGKLETIYIILGVRP